MTGVPLSYIIRNLWVRKLTTVLTAGGMALLVFVFAAVLMLAPLSAFASDPEIKFEKYQLPNGLTVILSEDHRLPGAVGPPDARGRVGRGRDHAPAVRAEGRRARAGSLRGDQSRARRDVVEVPPHDLTLRLTYAATSSRESC